VWEEDLRLFSPVMLQQWSIAMLATAALMAALLGTLFAAQGEWDALPMLAVIIAGATGGLWLLGLLIMAVLFRGRIRVRYAVTADGIEMETTDRVARSANRAATIVGALARSPGLTGAGLIGVGREREAVRWRGAFRAVPDPGRHVIAIRNRWRDVMLVQCSSENFELVRARIAEAMHAHRTETRVESRSPLPFYLIHSLLVFAASSPLVMLAKEYDLDLLLPILVLCFALATLWLINIFGWVVCAGLLLLFAGTLLNLSSVRESVLSPGETYTGFDVIGDDEGNVLALALAGSIYLTWLAIRAIRGRFLALLVRDSSETDGG
jgi:hypothetical protein